MLDIFIKGILENWILVSLSLLMLIGGTIAAYRKFGIRRVLLGKSNDSRELVYRRPDNSIVWKETLKTWKIILTGGMSLLTIFLIMMLLILSVVYAMDMNATRKNDELLCQKFGTVNPTPEQLEEYYGVGEENISKIKLTEVIEYERDK